MGVVFSSGSGGKVQSGFNSHTPHPSRDRDIRFTNRIDTRNISLTEIVFSIGEEQVPIDKKVSYIW